MRTGRDVLAALVTPTDELRAEADGVLAIAGARADELLAAHGSPLYVLSEPTLRANYRRLRDAFAARWPAGVVVLYAVKANNNLAVRALMHQEGAGGDCFGDGELHATFAGGADPATVALNGSNKLPGHIREGVRRGVCFNVDGEDELELIEAAAAELGTVARVCLRLKVFAPEFGALSPDFRPDQASLSKELREGQWGMSQALVERLARRALELPHVDFEGYQSHIGRESTDPAYHAAVGRAFARAVVELAQRTGAVPRVIDAGGGFARERDPESRRPQLNPHTIEDYAEALVGGLRSVLDDAPFPLPDLWLEPGRYLAGNAGVLLATVGSVKRDLGRVWLNVDASINNLMRAETGGFHYHVLPATQLDAPYAGLADVVGSLCTGHALAFQRELPELRRGDALAFLDAGMYAETASTQFNGVPRPATVLAHAGGVDLVKRREEVADVFRQHVIPDRLRAARAGV